MKLLTSEKKEKSTVEITFEVTGEEFEEAIEAAYRKERGRILIQGFRKGKAPRKMIERMYGDNFFWEDAVNESYGKHYDLAVAEAELDSVGKPDLEVLNISGEGYTIKAIVPVRPEINVSDYKGIEAVRYPTSVDPKEVDDELDRMRKRNARVETVTRKIKKGDTAVIDYEGFVDGVAFEGGKGENHSLEIGSGSFIPGFEEALIGKKAGEECDVEVTFPEEYHAPDLAGKAAVFKCKVHEVKQSTLPELDDEFAKDVSEFDTLDELKADMTAKMLESREESVASGFESAVMDVLAGKVEGAIPNAMIESQTDGLIDNMRYRLQSQGIDFDTYTQITGMTESQMREEYRARAEQQVKLGLALDKIVVLEGLTASDEDTEAEYTRLSEQYKMPLEQVKIIVNDEDLRKDLLREKASKLVLDSAVALPPETEKPKKTPTKKAKPEADGTEALAEDKPKKAPAKKPAAKPKADKPADAE